MPITTPKPPVRTIEVPIRQLLSQQTVLSSISGGNDLPKRPSFTSGQYGGRDSFEEIENEGIIYHRHPYPHFHYQNVPTTTTMAPRTTIIWDPSRTFDVVKPRAESMCGDINMEKLKGVSPVLGCCGNAVYDPRYFTCQMQTPNTAVQMQGGYLPKPVEAFEMLPQPAPIRQTPPPPPIVPRPQPVLPVQTTQSPVDLSSIMLRQLMDSLFNFGQRPRMVSLRCLDKVYQVEASQAKFKRCCMSQLFDTRTEYCLKVIAIFFLIWKLMNREMFFF